MNTINITSKVNKPEQESDPMAIALIHVFWTAKKVRDESFPPNIMLMSQAELDLHNAICEVEELKREIGL